MTDLFELESEALFSPCGKYRYRLSRQLVPHVPKYGGRTCLFVMLNPSTADATENDQTIRRCIGFARGWGFDWLHVVNLFAITATDPTGMLKAEDPVGPENDLHLLGEASAADMVVCAWGKHGAHRGRAQAVASLLHPYEPRCLATNQDGSPKHPLYVAASAKPYPWSHA
jgi:hypothetical protein